MQTQQTHISRWLAIAMSAGVLTVFAPDAAACNSLGLNGRSVSARPLVSSGSVIEGALGNWLNDGQKSSSPTESAANGAAVEGMWVTTFYLGSTNELFDRAIQQFFPGGNEVMSSALFAPGEGNICFGVWNTTAERTYRVRHIAWVFHPNGALHGVGRIVSVFTVTAQGGTLSGTYVSDVIDLKGNVIPGTVVQGVIKGRRFGGD